MENAPGDCAGSIIRTVMKGLFRTILDDHRDVAMLRHAISTFACLLYLKDGTMTVSFDDPLLDDIIRKIEELKMKASENASEKSIV